MLHSLGPKAQSLLQPAMAFSQNIMVVPVSLPSHVLLFSSLHFPPTCVPFLENLYSIFKTLSNILRDKYMTLSPLLCFSLTSSLPIESSLSVRELSTDSISNSHDITLAYIFIAPTRPGPPAANGGIISIVYPKCLEQCLTHTLKCFSINSQVINIVKKKSIKCIHLTFLPL